MLRYRRSVFVLFAAGIVLSVGQDALAWPRWRFGRCVRPVPARVAAEAAPTTASSDATRPIADAEKAKAALLRLIRSDRKLFVGDPNPDRLESIAVEAYDSPEPSKFSWGRFIIDVKIRTYSAAIGGEGAGMWFYSGVFEVDAAGRWTASQPSSQHAAAIPNKG